MSGDGGFAAAVAALRHRDFSIFWGAAVISNTGSFMQGVTVPFVIYELTGSSGWLGIAALCSLVPPVLVGPASGAIADRYQRRQVLIVTQILQMIAAFVLWLLWASGHATVTSMLVTVVIGGLAGGINITSWQSFVPSLVPPENLLGAIRLNSIQFNVSRAMGPALAGLTLSSLGAGASFMVNAVTYILVIGALAVVHPRPNVATKSNRSFVTEFREGLRYIGERPGLLHSIVTGAMSSMLVMGIVQQAPAIAERQLHTGGSGYGLLLAVQGAGTLVCSMVLAVYADRVRRSRMTLSGLTTEVAAVVAMSLATSVVTGVGAFAVLGVAQMMVVVSQQTSIQVMVDDAYRGRVMSVYLMGTMLGPPVGAVVMGAIADATTLRTTLLLAASAMIVYISVATLKFNRLRGLDGTLAMAATTA
ncbi:MAG: MFS transporter [Acidimicrobiia bacterium]